MKDSMKTWAQKALALMMALLLITGAVPGLAEQTAEEIYTEGMKYLKGDGVDKDLNKAFLLLKQAAEMDYAPAQYETALCYQFGDGVEKDEEQALAWLQKAAHQNYDKAVFWMGRVHFYGWLGFDFDVKTAREYYEKAAELGNVEASIQLGFMYETGQSVERNYDKAREYYEKAAATHPKALSHLGFMHMNGWGVPQDDEKAVALLQEAVDKGSVTYLEHLGWYYEKGVVVQQDYQKAIELYQKGVESGLGYYHTLLGRLHRDGRGFEQSYEKAMEEFQLGALANDPEAYINIGHLYKDGLGVEKDEEKAQQMYLAAYNAYYQSTHRLNVWLIIGYLREHGLGIEQSLEAAHSVYERSVSLDDSRIGMYHMARFYENGLHVEKNLEQALALYKQSADHGYPDAYVKLGIFAAEGLGMEKDLNLAKEYFTQAQKRGAEGVEELLKKYGL
ncbi:MAG TPA: sel1 repeat family protein [Clostridiales bacterium]|nr:sel1 repeat family protein [Clostridiales bacterium]